jgi:hypothetical protein
MKKTIPCLMFITLIGCSKKENPPIDNQNAVMIVNEGNFMWGNTSVSLYNKKEKTITKDIYQSENGVALGDVAQSIFQKDSLLFIVVNNTSKIEVISSATFKRKWTINIPNSYPRHFCAVNDSIALVSELYANKLWVINYLNATVVSSVAMEGETGQIQYFDNKIAVLERTKLNGNFTAQIRILDASNFQTIKKIILPSEPNSFGITANKKLYVLTDKGNSSSLPAKLFKFDLVNYAGSDTFNFELGENPKILRVDAVGQSIKWIIDKKMYSIGSSATTLSSPQVLTLNTSNIYAFDIDPSSGDLYIGDALDYTQASQIFRFDKNYLQLDQFKAGINTTQFLVLK